MDENVIAEVDGYRVRLAVDEGPEQPYNDGSAPVWEVTPSRNYTDRVDARQLTDLTSYRADDRIAEAIDRLWVQGGNRVDTLERYLRIFWGVTATERWHSGSYWYFTCDPVHWREAMGITEKTMQREGYGDDLMVEWKAWCNGEVYVAIVEQKAHWRRTDSAGAPVMLAAEDLHRETWEFEDSVGGLYGDDYAKQSALSLLAEYVPELGIACGECPWMHVALDENERWDALFTHMVGTHQWRTHKFTYGPNNEFQSAVCRRSGCNTMGTGDFINDEQCEGRD